MCIRDRCYNCGKSSHLQADRWQTKNRREERECTNWRCKDTELHTVSTLYKTTGNLIVNGLMKDKQAAFTVDTGSTVSVVRPDLATNRQPQFSSCTIQIVTGSPVKVLEKEMCIRDRYPIK